VTWVKIDDQMPDHPKFAALGPLGVFAFTLQLRALCYSARYLTDGVIPEAVVPTLLAGFDAWSIETGGVENLVAVGAAASDHDWPALMVAQGLWDRQRNGNYRIHDYHGYNPTRDTVLKEREANTKRQQRHRARNGPHNAVTNATNNGPVTGAPSPSPSLSTETTSPEAAPPPPENPRTWKADAAVTLRKAGVVEREIGDAIKNWWAQARRRFTDPEIAAVVLAHGRRFAAKGETWNPARVWNPRNEDFDERFRWAISQQRKAEARSPTKGIQTVQQVIGGVA